MELFGDTLSLALQNLLDERRAGRWPVGSLTSLFNDRLLPPEAPNARSSASPGEGGRPLATSSSTATNLKKVTDEHGHLAGARSLREVSFIMQRVSPRRSRSRAGTGATSSRLSS